MSEVLRRWLHDDVGIQHPVDTFEEVSLRASLRLPLDFERFFFFFLTLFSLHKLS